MADTQRTSTDLLTNLFQDGQAAGSITPQDMRDLIVSMISPHGGIYVSTPAATTITVAGTYYLCAGTWSSSGTAPHLVTEGAAARLTYTGTVPIHATLRAGVSMTCGTNNQVVGACFVKNGVTTAPGSIARTKLGTAGDVQRMSVAGVVELANGDYVELFLTNETGTNAVTVANGIFDVVGHFE